MFRLGLAGRLILIVLFGMLALLALLSGLQWLGRSSEAPEAAERRLPGQVAALVAFYERAPADLRQSAPGMFDPNLRIAILKEQPKTETGDVELLAVKATVQSALTSAGEQAVVVSARALVDNKTRFPRLSAWLSSQQTFEVLVRLSTGEFLSVQGKGRLGEKIYGIPPGFWLGSLGFLIGALTLIGIMREARPLRQLSLAMARFSGSAKPQPLPRSTTPDTAQLIVAFDTMQHRIASLISSRGLVIGAVSHDLKTYMTRLRFRVEAVDNPEIREKAIADLEDMQKALTQALDFARGISGDAKRDTINLSALVQEEVEACVAQGLNVAEVTLASGVQLTADRIALKRVVANLIDNAVKHGERAKVTLTATDTEAVLVVDDEGPGIPKERRTEIFEPFFRLDEARSNPSQGSGLGLAIAQQIVESHKGHISVTDAPMGGARFEVHLPLTHA
jgi:two-component system, OmpR family, osmolarity sensor histidine kinase EnvZ